MRLIYRLRPRNIEYLFYTDLILASASSGRTELLRQAGIAFEIDPAHIDEAAVTAATTEELVCEMAFKKAQETGKRHPGKLILGADTLGLDDAGIFGKPDDAEHAKEMLARLSGKTHYVISGLTLLEQASGRHVNKMAKSAVQFRQLSQETIDRYVATGEPVGKAGGYAIQGIGSLLVASIEGDYSNVVGLPVADFVDALAELGYELI